MLLEAETQLGPYEIGPPLGAGGMGEVYRAHDTNLDRDVAIKVLPDVFVRDPERVARFGREAKVLASLNYPNIAAVHGFEESDGKRFLVMELVGGDTLLDRLKTGRMELPEALTVGKQMAEALEAAHASGVIHRDLKPGNVKVTSEGIVKVLDFGLAKAMAGGDRSASDIANSPTITANYTRPGVVLGTVAYMSPEQARGRPLDKRTDIWSFGCVLYECLAGQRPFDGETTSDTIAKILERDPDLGHLPFNTPPAVRHLIQRCLEKDRNRRLRDIGDAVLDLDEVISTRARSTSDVQPYQAGPYVLRHRAFLAVAGLTLLVGGLLLGALLWRRPADVPITPIVTRTTITLPEDAPIVLGVGRSLAISRDGTRISYRAVTASGVHIYTRALHERAFRKVPGTRQAADLFFSPDGQGIGYPVSGKTTTGERGLFKYSLAGGFRNKILNNPPPWVNWCEDGNLYFDDTVRGLKRLSGDGGDVVRVIKEPASGPAKWLGFAALLPVGEWLIYTEFPLPLKISTTRTVVRSLRTGESREVFAGGVFFHYLSTGHLLISQERGLLAAPFDLDSLSILGQPVKVLDGVHNWFFPPQLALDVSDNGTLVYVEAGDSRAGIILSTVSRSGKEAALPVEPGWYSEQRFSPDGSRIVFTSTEPGVDVPLDLRIWMYDRGLDRLSRVTGMQEIANPVWAPDGRRLAFNHFVRPGLQNIYVTDVDGLEDPIRVTATARSQWPADWSPDGRWIGWVEGARAAGDVWMLEVKAAMDGHRGQEAEIAEQRLNLGFAAGRRDLSDQLHGVKTVPLFVTEADETSPAISPDGRWIAYVSNVSGRDEVYVTAFPKPGQPIPVSPQGGVAPVWSRNPDHSELFFRMDNAIMAAEYSGDDPLVFLRPKEVLSGPYNWSTDRTTPRNYDVSPDGTTFLLGRWTQADNDREIHIVQNWHEELQRRLPTRTN